MPKQEKMSDDKILCPSCEWEPQLHSMWYCTCGHNWNTFDTAGRCPQCTMQWKETQCHRCHTFSPHLDWYQGLAQDLEQELISLEKIIH